MVDSRDKGARAELKVRDELRSLTNLKWERIPASGALAAVHQLKGDLYIPGEYNIYCIEVKHYADDKFTSKILTDSKPQIDLWWEQTIREAHEVNKKPMLIFKHDRSKLFCAVDEIFLPVNEIAARYIFVGHLGVYIMKLEDFINHCYPDFIRT